MLSHRYDRQAGLGAYAMVGLLAVLGVIFLTVFIFASSSNKRPTQSGQNQGQDQNQTEDTEQEQTASSEPPFIRVPDNSLLYKSSNYKFSFAYPSSFAKLTEKTPASNASGLIFQSESAPAVKKPVGNSGAVLTGVFGAYVYKQDDFKLSVGQDTFVAPTKTGSSITWRVVSTGATTKDIAVGNAFSAKSSRSQTGVTVFDFTINDGISSYGRYVFQTGDHYVILVLPYASKPSGTALSDSDLAAYKVIGANLASTVRSQASTSTQSSTDNSGTSTDSNNSSTTTKPN